MYVLESLLKMLLEAASFFLGNFAPGHSTILIFAAGHYSLGLGVRVTQKFQVGFFGLSKFRVLKISTRNSVEIIETRKFGYPTFRVRVYPTNPNCGEEEDAEARTRRGRRRRWTAG